jgi:hypothetical protein
MYDKEDALDAVMYNLLSVLDVDEGNNKGKVDISINENDLQIDDQTISTIPYLWGPAILEVRVWK